MADGLVPPDDDLRHIGQSAVGQQILDLVPHLARDYADPLPAGLQPSKGLLRIGERHCSAVRIRPDDLEEPPLELVVACWIDGVLVEHLVHGHAQVVIEPGRVVLHAQCREGGAQNRLDPRLGVEERVVEIEQVQFVFLHLVAT